MKAVDSVKTFTACGMTLSASFVHHLGLALFMRANKAGIVPATNARLAADIRDQRTRVTTGLVVLRRLLVMRTTRSNRRKASFHALNLGGLDWPAGDPRLGTPSATRRSPATDPADAEWSRDETTQGIRTQGRDLRSDRCG